MSSGPGRARGAAADFIRSEAAGGVFLLVAVFLAMIWANVISGDGYFSFWGTDLTLGVGSLSITEDLQHWINDALMAIFFFVVGLEIKRELTVGELNDRRKAALPVIAAFGGVILPALIFIAFNAGGAFTEGWAIPMATDIAFAVAVIALLGSRIPSGVRLLLLTIAIVDDLIAISVIAIFYTDSISLDWLAFGLAGLGLTVVLRRFGAVSPLWFIPAGVLAWLGFFESGVHATIAGVALGLLTPARPVKGRPVLENLEHRLHPWTTMVIVPLFALANAGVQFSREVISDAVASPLFQGILVGLVVGKLLGIAGSALLSTRLGIASLPSEVTRRHVWGVAALGGIGFTVSLFITGLSFTDHETVEIAKIGVFAGSLVSATLGSATLLARTRKRKT
ncbi:MAG: Na+/H+ antiporter NhaA [Actinomycetota bacterium]|nr:Na+/H+ antiporter NhaA [Actinomycetota bacterium]